MRVPFSRVLLVLMLAAPLAPASAQQHTYHLNGTLADQNGGPSLVSDGGLLTSSGYLFGRNQGLSLSNVFTTGVSYSLVIHSRLDSVAGWRKIVDFKNLAADSGFYDWYGYSTLYFSNTYAPASYADGVWATTVLTRDFSNDMFTWYVDGVKRFSYLDGGKYGEFTATNNIARFFEDDYHSGQSEVSPGAVDYIATYDTVLSDAEVAAIQFPTVPEPSTVVLVATGLVGIGAMARRRRKARRSR